MKLERLGIILVKLVAVGLLVAALARHQYGYYTLLRWVVCAVCVFAAYQAAESEKTGWPWALAVVAIVFNPLIPVRLDRETWAFVDLAVAALLLVSIAALDRRVPPPNSGNNADSADADD